MIVLNPMGGSNQRVIEANGLKDYDVNYNFASYLGKYLQARGESVTLTRSTSEALTTIEFNRLITNAAPDVTFHIKCLEDISSEPQGYTLECDVYSALAATISSEFQKWGATPTYPLGYKVQTKKISAKYTEIIIGIGYITNPEDAARMGDATKLESLARAIIDAAYGPPTKVMQPKDDVYVPDPYLYSPSKWSEQTDTKLTGDTGAIVDDTIENIPAKILRLVTVGEHLTPYTWSTPVTIVDTAKSYVLIVSAKTRKPGCKSYVSVGSVVQDTVFSDDTWHRITFDYVDGDTVYLGAYGDADIDYTALWVTPKGTLGNLDDPQSQYSIFPPGYRPITSIDPTAVDKSLIPSVVTQANSLIGRAQDTKLPDLNSGLQEVLSKIDQVALNPKALVSSIQGVTGQLTTTALKSVNILDPSTVLAGIDYKGFENMLKNMSRGDKRASLQKSINDMKGVEKAAAQLVTTQDQKLDKAKKQAELIKKRLERKGEAMSKT